MIRETRDLREVVNKIIVTITDDEPTTEQIASLASDLAAFFDASVVLVYLGKLPLNIPSEAGQAGGIQMAASAVDAIEDRAQTILDSMAEIMVAHGVTVSARVVIGTGSHAIREIIEKENCDLVVLPHWQGGAAERLIRVFSPSVLEDATCPVLVLKGNKWLTKSRAARPSHSNKSTPSAT
jgi:nucleotide-binding universal stress UspA family protein